MATLVTGAFGCIGSWVIRRLLAAGERPVAYDLGDDPWRLLMIVGPEPLKDVAFVKGDIRQDPAGGARVNVLGTANVFEAARARKGQVERIVYFCGGARPAVQDPLRREHRPDLR